MTENLKYVEPKLLINSFLENIGYKDDMESFTSVIRNIELSLTEDEIKNILEKKFIEDEHDVYKRLSHANIPNKDLKAWKEEEILNNYQTYFDLMIYEKYRYDSNMFNYANNTFNNLKTRFLKLISFINDLSYNQSNVLKDINKYDINIKDNLISNIDFIRLYSAMIELYKELYDFLEKANNIKFYLLFPSDLKDKIKKGDKSLYPSTDLQSFNGDERGFIKLSDNQISMINSNNYNVKVKK